LNLVLMVGLSFAVPMAHAGIIPEEDDDLPPVVQHKSLRPIVGGQVWFVHGHTRR
jgi:hypothetical protein